MKKISTIISMVVLATVFFGCNRPKEEKVVVAPEKKFTVADSLGQQNLVNQTFQNDTAFSGSYIAIERKGQSLCSFISLPDAIDGGLSLGLPTFAQKGHKKINITSVQQGLKLAKKGYHIIVLVKPGTAYEKISSERRTIWNIMESI